MPLIVLVLLSVLSSPAREWRDSIRDVYVDGKVDRNAQTLVTTAPRMLAVVCGDEVLLFDPESKTVSRASKSDFTFAADRTVATTAAIPGERVGELTHADTTLHAMIDGKNVLVATHQSKAGAMTVEELWQTAPVWRAIAEHYEPDGAVVERLRAIRQPMRLQIVLATWCGDSRQHVPRLLKAIERAANPNLTVELIGIGPDFLSPMELVQGENITTVPTVIVRAVVGGRANEIGRFVETPAAKTIEEDIADIAAGTPKPHPGRHERGALLTRGTYALRDAWRRHQGTETFEIYERPGGGQVVHSVIRKRDGTSIETWAAIDAEKKPRFVETTHRGATVTATATRTRFRRDGETWLAHSRGATGGIVDQTVTMPAALITPATVTYAWARDAASVYEVPESGIGATRAAKFRVGDGEVPRFVRLEDGSSRVILRRVDAEGSSPVARGKVLRFAQDDTITPR